jgi:F-type H+-transporting ATPase subunit epsilon
MNKGDGGGIRLKIITPDAIRLDKLVDEVVAPGEEGYFGVLPGHIPFFSLIKPGSLSYRIEGVIDHFAVGRGYAEVLPDAVTLFVDVAEARERINGKRAELELHRAEEVLAREQEAEKREKAEYSRAKALARLEVIRSGRGD